MVRRQRASFPRLWSSSQIASRGRRGLVGQPARGRPRCQGPSIGVGCGIDNGKFRVISESDIFEVANIREDTVGIVDLRGMEGGGLGRFRSRQLGRGVGARVDSRHDFI